MSALSREERKMHIRSIIMAAAASLVVGSSAVAASYAGGIIQSQKIGGHEVLTDMRGRALYVYDKDGPNKSNCNGFCRLAWPPQRATKNAVAHGDFAPIPASGGPIWAYKGHPLYRYAGDHNPGEITGDGADGVWHVVVVR